MFCSDHNNLNEKSGLTGISPIARIFLLESQIYPRAFLTSSIKTGTASNRSPTMP